MSNQPMKTSITRLKEDELPTLNHLMQLYLYDFSVFLCDSPIDAISDNGLYDPGYPLERYLIDDDYHGYLMRVEQVLAGFVLTSTHTHYRQSGHIIDEFFVLRCYRRKGVGRRMACLTFDTHKGYWEIAQIKENTLAQIFWRTVIHEYTKGRYKERTGEFDEVWQMFDSSTW